MSDIECPYCGTHQEINHDDGYGYDESQTHEQECVQCGKEFKFTTSIMYVYSAYCNKEEDHVMEKPFPEKYPDYYTCTKCEHSDYRA